MELKSICIFAEIITTKNKIMRTLNETATIVEKAIKEILKAKKVTYQLIYEAALKYEVSVDHLINVGGWSKVN